MRSLWLLFGLFTAQLHAQDSIEDPAKLVLTLLNDSASSVIKDAETLLTAHSWESLAYWDSGTPSNRENLYEAVPDVYRFQEGMFDLILYQQDAPSGQKIKGHYRLDGNQLMLLDQNGFEVLDRWRIHYLDKHYLAVDMDGLRVFFVAPDNDPF